MVEQVTKKTNLVLIGMPTAGKTTLSLRLSQEKHMKYFGMDYEIAKQAGMEIPEIFVRFGETYFRDLETKMAETAAKLSNTVIDCGGGVVVREENIKLLKQSGILIWRDRSLENLFASDDRPLSRSKEDVERLYRQRYELYHKYADIIVTGKETLDSAFEEILKQVELYENSHTSL